MAIKQVLQISFIVFFVGIFLLKTSAQSKSPVVPDPSPEAKALLELMYTVSGKYTLTGQHNYPATFGANTNFAARYTGKIPAVWSSDMGFADMDSYDYYKSRPGIVQEAIRQHKKGSIITLCWHAVPPTADEPVTFRPKPGDNPDSIASVQGKLTEQQFRDLLTPETMLHERWCAQVDTIAKYLKDLQDARVPVLWRPYHEMNGSWFWWGGRIKEYPTKDLYVQIFNRLTHHHKLNNLIWVWSVDRIHNDQMEYQHYFPGLDFVDILALDVYGNDYKQRYYNDLMGLSEGKPLVLAEVGNPPAPEILANQPKWGLYVVWAGMCRNTNKAIYKKLMSLPSVLSLNDPDYWVTLGDYRKACGMKPLGMMETKRKDFEGRWVINEELTQTNSGLSTLPYQLDVSISDQEIKVKRVMLSEFQENRVEEDTLKMGGEKNIKPHWGSEMITLVNWENENLVFDSKFEMVRDGKTTETGGKEIWMLKNNGTQLHIERIQKQLWGEQKSVLVFDVGF